MGGTTVRKFIIREPLFCGPFGAFLQAERFPAWSCESKKSPGLLHVHNCQLQFALEDNFQRALFLAVYKRHLAHAASDNIGVEIKEARLITKWVLPPPRLVSAALTQSVNYATFDVLRFRADQCNKELVKHNET